MLAGDGAADFDAQGQDVGAECLGTVKFARLIGIEQNQGMQIAVAGVEHVGAAQAVLHFHRLDADQDLGQLLARDGAVHAVVVGRDAARRREGVLAAGPELHALRFRLRHLDGAGAGRLQHLRHALDFLVHFELGAVRFAQQNGGGVDVVAGLDERLDHARRRAVHHFKASRDDAGGDHAGHRVAAGDDVVERRHDDARRLRLGHQLDRHFGDDAEHAFGADEDRQQVQAGRVKRLAAQFDDVAVDGGDPHAQHVVHGQAVFEAVHAARIFGHVAADGAGDLRGRVGRVIQAERCGRFRNGQVAHARLDHRGARVLVDAHDAVHARGGDDDAVGDRQCAAGQAGAGAARHDRHLQLAADSENRQQLRLAVGQGHHHRQLTVGGQAIALVGTGVFRVGQHAAFRQRDAQGAGNLLPADGID